MKHLLGFLLLTTSTSLFAMNKPKMIILDKNVETKGLEKDYDLQKEAPKNLPMPSNRELRVLFQDEPLVSKMDELDRDILFMNLKTKTLPELQKKYPDFPPKKLEGLKKKVQGL